MNIHDLRCEYHPRPLGITEPAPRLSWRLHGDERGLRQSAYHVRVASAPARLDAGDPDLWDSGKIQGADSIHVEYAGRPLVSRARCWWQVRGWDDADRPSDWSDPGYWEMGLLNPADWTALWVAAPHEDLVPADAEDDSLFPCPLLRTRFELPGDIVSARLYITARGLYEARINGQRVGDDRLAPGWTDFSRRIRVQTHDVTDLLRAGDNVMAAVLGTGWYAGHVGWYRRIYGKTPELLAQLEVTRSDGSTLTIAGDETWQWRTGPLLESDLLMGERYDARLEIPGWDTVGGDDRGWRPVTVTGPVEDGPLLEAPVAPMVKAVREFDVRETTEPVPGTTIFDLGQNMVGHVRLRVRAEAGRELRLRFGEVLNPDGTLYVENLRKARATDVYICRGDPEGETWEPRFTFHGFRYVELTGLTEPPGPDTVRGVVVHSAMEPTGSFECSHAKLNQLQHNIEWGQRGNYLEVPTDCPQRDERLGWMGDAQVFTATGCFNFNTAPFNAKWLQDVVDAQHADGGFTNYAPEPRCPTPWSKAFSEGRCSPAWTDAGVIVPWTIYERYGDLRILERCYDAMVRYIDLVEREAADGIGPDTGFGDWLNDYAFTPLDLISTAFNIHSTDLMMATARVLGRGEDAARFADLAGRFREAFCRRFVTPDGRIVGDTQTAYALALRFRILPETLRDAARARLEHDIEHGRSAQWPYPARKGHISSGFVGVNQVLPCLVEGGSLALAYRLLLNDDYPSWLFQVNHGATTIWERWDGYHPDRGFQDPGMNSFNHYAYGAVGQWLYETVAGLAPAEPGYRVLRVAPRLDPERRITRAAATLDTLYGTASVEWTVEAEALTLTVRVPPNTEAEIHVPTEDPASVREGGEPLPEQAPWLRARDGAMLRVGSGDYLLSARPPDATAP